MRQVNGKFDTAKEAEYYPLKLAREFAVFLMDQLLPSGKFQMQDELHDHAFKVTAGSQPRRTRGPLSGSR